MRLLNLNVIHPREDVLTAELGEKNPMLPNMSSEHDIDDPTSMEHDCARPELLQERFEDAVEVQVEAAAGLPGGLAVSAGPQQSQLDQDQCDCGSSKPLSTGGAEDATGPSTSLNLTPSPTHRAHDAPPGKAALLDSDARPGSSAPPSIGKHAGSEAWSTSIDIVSAEHTATDVHQAASQEHAWARLVDAVDDALTSMHALQIAGATMPIRTAQAVDSTTHAEPLDAPPSSDGTPQCACEPEGLLPARHEHLLPGDVGEGGAPFVTEAGEAADECHSDAGRRSYLMTVFEGAADVGSSDDERGSALGALGRCYQMSHASSDDDSGWLASEADQHSAGRCPTHDIVGHILP
jgi:hypothetical protein